MSRIDVRRGSGGLVGGLLGVAAVLLGLAALVGSVGYLVAVSRTKDW